MNNEGRPGWRLASCPVSLAAPDPPSCPDRACRPDEHDEDQQQPEHSVQPLIGVAADHEGGHGTDTDADRDPLHKDAPPVVGSDGRGRLAPGGEVCVDAGGYLAVDLLKERGHYRVAVLRTKVVMHRGGHADFFGDNGESLIRRA
jgi:hypothetical protein